MILLSSPPLIQSKAIDTTSIRIWWTGVYSATSYMVYRATIPDYSDAMLAGETSNFEFVDTGLTGDTIYYYQVKSVLTSENSLVSAKTNFATPVVNYEVSGLRLATDNEYGDSTGQDFQGRVWKLKSITGGPYLATGLNQGGILHRTNHRSGQSLVAFGDTGTKALTKNTGSNSLYTFSTPIVLEGDFTILARLEYQNSNRCIAGSANGCYLAFNGSGSVRIYITGTEYLFNFGTIQLNRLHDIVWRRQGSTLSISIDGGQNFSIASSSCKADNFVMETFTGGALTSNYSGSWSKLAIYDDALTSSQCGEVYNSLHGSNYNVTPYSNNTLNVYGVTWEDFPVDNQITYPSSRYVTGTPRRSFKVLNIADKTFICGHTNGALDYQTFIYVICHTTNKISSRIDLPVFPQDNEVHLDAGIDEIDGTLVHCQPNVWYDNTTSLFNTPWFRVFDKAHDGIDLSKFTETKYYNGIENGVLDDHGYFQHCQISGKRFMISASLMQGSGGGQRFNNIFCSESGLNSWEFKRIFDTEVGTRWAYPYTIYGKDKIRHFVNLWDDLTNQFSHLFYMESFDGKTWSNINGTFSKNISNLNHLSWIELQNYLVDSGAPYSVRCTNAHYDPNENEVFFISGDPSVSGAWNFYHGSPGATFFKKPIVVTGYNLVPSRDHEGGYIRKINSCTYELTTLIDTGDGLHRVVLIRTTDKGLTWNLISQLSVDDTKRHAYVHGTANQFNGKVVIDWTKVVNEGTGDVDGVGNIIFKIE